MWFISSGDFGFPFEWIFYFLKQFFVWSFQAGAANPDGIIRMPGRLLHLLVFMVFGNLAFDYFYLISSLVIAFFAFFYFATKVLQVNGLSARIGASLFFALNPIFLGNLAKVGLILAAAMLPLCLAMVHQGFKTKKFRYFLLWLLFLNISLIHPFNFAVNIMVSGLYLLYLANQDKKFVFSNIPKFIGIGVLAVLMNLYFLLPIASMNTLNKTVLSDTIVAEPVDYTELVDVLNTGTVFTGLSLSKNVVIDFEFYNDQYANFYFFGVFLLYVLLFGLFIKSEKNMLEKDRRRFVIMLIAFMTLIILATVTVFNVSELIKMLIQMPGGWTFRSPLKWQLYIPLALSAMLVILLEYMSHNRWRWRKLMYGGFILSFVLMNGFLFTDIFNKLLTPRTITQFATLQQTKFSQDNLLLVGGDTCTGFQQKNPRVMTELNQILSSKYVQLKRIGANDIGLVNLASYDYIMDCQGIMERGGLAKGYDFTLKDSYVDGVFKLYANTNKKPYVYPADSLIELANPTQLGNYYDFTTDTLDRDFDYMQANDQVKKTAIGVQDVFEDLSFDNIKNGNIVMQVPPISAGRQQFYAQSSGVDLYYTTKGEKIHLTNEPQPGYKLLMQDSQSPIPITVPKGKKLQLAYTDTGYSYANAIPNGSFEQGPWQKTVGDCYNYDKNPLLSMELDKKQKTNGQQSLKLESANHIACTSTNSLRVFPDQTYLLSFDYMSQKRAGGYSVTFNDSQKTTINGRLSSKDGWEKFTKIIKTPVDATSMRLAINAYPTGGSVGVARYDNFKLSEVADIANKFYLVSGANNTLSNPKKLSYQFENPTRTSIKAEGVSTPFYVATSETFSNNWRLNVGQRGAGSWLPFSQVDSIPIQNHLQINGMANAWYIDPAELCKTPGVCAKQADGSYDISFVMEFVPQRWLYLGMIISGVAIAGILGYVIYDVRRGRGRHEHYKS